MKKIILICHLFIYPLSIYPSSFESDYTNTSSAQQVNKWHILYLMQSKEWDKSIDLYRQYQKELGHHDFEILQQMATIILDQGTKSSNAEQQLISIFGTGIAGIGASIDILEAGITSQNPQTQMATIQFLGQMHDDRSEELLIKAMSSDYFFTRMEAAQQLAIRKSRVAVGQIESLMHKVPPQMRFFFPQFFALIGTTDAISVLKHLMDEPFLMTRIESIMSAAKFGRDDLLPSIRARATHALIAELETCAAALGWLKDSKSIPLLTKLTQNTSSNVQLAALRSLYMLGDETIKQQIIELANKEDLYAIYLLGEIPGSEDLLYTLTQHPLIHVRLNAIFGLLSHRDPRCLEPLKEFILRDSKDLGFQPQTSIGHSLHCWKVIPSAMQHQKESSYDLSTLSLNVREHLLRLSLELPEDDFLKLATHIFDAQQGELIPFLIKLLEALQTEKAILLLKYKAQTAGAPLIRAYCVLSLLRLKQEGSYESSILQWIEMKKDVEMIRFRPMLPWDVRIHKKNNTFELTPEEHSQLLVLCYQTLADRHDTISIDILLEGLKNGHPKNRSVLAGLLIYALQ